MISRFRNVKFASPVLLLLALVFVGSTFSAISARAEKPAALSPEARSVQIEEGRQIFLKGCSSCHGLNAEGSDIAPSLIGVGAASVDFQVATGRMPMADICLLYTSPSPRD